MVLILVDMQILPLTATHCTYRKVVSTNPSRLIAHAGFFRLSMKGKLDVYSLGPFGKKLISIL